MHISQLMLPTCASILSVMSAKLMTRLTRDDIYEEVRVFQKPYGASMMKGLAPDPRSVPFFEVRVKNVVEGIAMYVLGSLTTMLCLSVVRNLLTSVDLIALFRSSM